ncbi:MAG TPA: hypothetical protein VGZ28_09915 [Terriglobales bacterium]|jgi:hypothetical protein|nr:hypothetical protein [Terriglobales bacterium]
MRAIFYVLLLIGIVALMYGQNNLSKPWVTEYELDEYRRVGWISVLLGAALVIGALAVNR